MCDCISYNQSSSDQKTPNEILIYPWTGKKVCVDACISKSMEALWAAGIETHGSCCTHGAGMPEVIIKDNATQEEIETARKTIRKVDNRDWAILSWTLLRHEEG